MVKKALRMLMIGFIIASTSQLYINFLVDGFRVSTSVILFPVFLLSYRDLNIVRTSIITGIMVFLFREAIMLIQGEELLSSVIKIFPGGVFYIIYGLIFKYSSERNRYYDFSKIFFTALMCDFCSNIAELFLRMSITFTPDDFSTLTLLFIIAATRSTIVLLIFFIIRNYKNLLTKEEHEARYQNLILITSDLKGEIYFMKKNVETIENIMSNSYILYEQLSQMDGLSDLKQLSLNLTTDIHEIKKDYIRVIQGIEDTLIDKMQVAEMSIKDIFSILRESTYRTMESSSLSVSLEFRYDTNFVTKEHYQLMSILANLVNNALEAFSPEQRNCCIKIHHSLADNCHIFTVSDNGSGISPGNLKYIFTPGFSTKFDYKTGDVYRGVGLSHVKTIVTEHFKGNISVDSVLEKGTAFEIKIPADSLEAQL